ncbi:hypothetical protein CRE_16494 [Caenorhabditis remanei]|uniref:Uncharacterized protein n=1 Tax=Caenorhabditis remanei TaxID=31234 RepID=E3NLM3_CAERE|nr:hypothetical protein CRE_16494 [Caenorhabditis remanei]
MLSSTTQSSYNAPTTATSPGNFSVAQVIMNNENPSRQMQIHPMNEMPWFPMDIHQGIGHGMMPAMSPVTPAGMASQMSLTPNGNFPPMA